ncbi:speckle-type poz [Diplodia corticola]|uniref:Speckle-type poz n=1 Tax=Diplodia corticola TaxID=236234 RepID=A0A1J9RRM3_9PEZI|nr:speckle-type poz [Diplodia corticola]OJD30548.1 speckle-type poz [Diplodia corticola]
MAALVPHVERVEDVAAFLWQTREYSDVTISTGDHKEINAHKAIICIRNKFFENCLRHGFAESFTNRVELPENFEIVEALLQSLYGVDVPLLHVSGEECKIQKLISLYSSADKYGVALQEKVCQTFSACLEMVETPETILSIAWAVYDQTPYFDVQLRSATINHVQAHLDTILCTDESASVLMGNSQLAVDMLRRTAPMLQEQAQALKAGSVPTTPKKRRSPRNATHTPGTHAFRVRMY